jgi:glycosyltransferase involved in cell wall biosynthesis
VTLSVLHVSQPDDGGVARAVSDLVADQLGRGWQVGLASPEGGLAERVRELGADHFHWRARRAPGPGSFGEAIRLRRIVGRADPDLLHLHSSKAGLAGRLAVRGRRPTLFQPHAWSFHALGGRLRRAAAAWERLGARWATAIVCVSEAERRDGEAAGIRANWRVVPNGVDLEAFRPTDRVDARARLGLPAGPLAVSVGRLSRQKGQDLLVEAWPKVRSRVEAAELVLVGSGPEESALRRSGGDVQFVGAQDDVQPWLAAADVVVLPSRWEGLPYVVLEAMAVGTPVVATDVTGVREALGEAGAIVPPEDPGALAEAVVAALSGADVRSGRRRVEELYDLRRSTQAMADLYLEVLGRSNQ